MNGFLLLFILLAILSASATYAPSLADEGENLQETVKGNTSFAADLYQNLAREKGNLFFSPYSISAALAMTYAGAKGRTADEMMKVLYFSSGQRMFHESFSMLQAELNTIQDKTNIKLSIANSLWAQKGYKFLQPFIELNKTYYKAEVNFVDFATKTESARQDINGWVEEKTQHKIKELIKPGMLDSLTRMVLCNAIYFRGNWLVRFDNKKTADAGFHVSREEKVEAPLMNLTSGFRVREFEAFSVLELPYEGNALSMFVFLPKDVDGLAELECRLTGENIKKWMDEVSRSNKREVDVSLPRFRTVREFELADVLDRMGMHHAFTDADFSNMSADGDLCISRVVHKAFVEVDEEGTEAAAATGVVMRVTSMGPNAVFRADHPFVFLIRENGSGSLLFMGRIVDPTL